MNSEQRTAWLEERRSGIGGSDAPAALGVSKWKTQMALYLEKRGEATTNESEPMYWGSAMEPLIRQRYADVTGRSVWVPQGIMRHAAYAWMIGTVDGIADQERLLEIKCAGTREGWGEPGSDEIPDAYAIQVQHYLAVAQLAVADVAVLFGGQKFELYEVAADAELQEMIIDGEREFWRRVLESDPPEPTSLADVRLRYPLARFEATTATAEIAQRCQHLANLKELIKALESREEELAGEITAAIGEHEGIVGTDGKPLATWKNAAATRRLDLEALKTERPEIYAAYLRDGKPARRLLLKVKGKGVCLPNLPNGLTSTVAALLSAPARTSEPLPNSTAP